MYNFVPSFIEKNINMETGNFYAYCINADMTGFTKTTEKFLKEGKIGAENLINIINIFGSPVVDSVYNNGGFVVSMPGDGLIAVFPEKNYGKIMQCLKEIQLTFEILTQIYNEHFRIGVSVGNIEWGISGTERKAYYFKGEAINKVTSALKLAETDQIVMDKNLLVNDDNIELKISESIDENYVIIDSITIKNYYISNYQNELVNFDTSRQFYPEEVLMIVNGGEFREVASIFIGFKDNLSHEKLSEFVNNVIKNIEIYGGYFNSLEFADKGGYILVNFGAPKSFENNIQRACDFILAVLHENKNVDLKAGLSYGLTYSGILGNENRKYYTTIGVITNLASRLMSKANDGEILFSESVYKEIKNNYFIEFKGSLNYKGFSSELNTYKLIGKKKNTLNYSFRSKYIGRQKESEKLKKYSEIILSGKNGGIVYIYGEAGIGKTRLLYETYIEQYFSCFNKSLLKCDSILNISMNPFKFYFKNFFGTTKESFELKFVRLCRELSKINDVRKDEYISSLKKMESVLASLVDIYSEGSYFDNLEPMFKYENIREAIKIFFCAFSLIKPLIIFLEDIHWIDNDSINIIDNLYRNTEEFPFLILATARFNDDESEPKLKILNDVKRKKIYLQPLLKEEVKKLFVSNLNGEPSELLLEYVYSKTYGNPFYVEEFCNYLKESKLIAKNKSDLYDGGEIDNRHIPLNINNILMARIDRLSKKMKEVAQCASVLGNEFDILILSRMLNVKNIYYYIEEGETVKLWDCITSMKCIFKHSILRDSIYSMQLKNKLAYYHKLAAETIKTVYGDKKERYIEIAYHYEKAEDKENAVEYLEKAADFANDTFLNAEAIHLYDRLLKYVDNKKKLSVLSTKGIIFQNIGRTEDSIETFIEAIELCDTKDYENMAKLYYNLASAYFNINENEDSIYLFDKCLENTREINDKSTEMKVYGGLGNIYRSRHDFKKAREYYIKELKIANELNDLECKTMIFGQLGNLYWEMQDIKKAHYFYKKTLELSEKIGSKKMISSATGSIGNIYYYEENFEAALKCYVKQYNLCSEIGYKRGMVVAVGNLGMLYSELGEFEKAIANIENKIELSKDTGDEKGIAVGYQNLGIVYLYLKDYKKCETYLLSAIELQSKWDMKLYYATSLYFLAELYFETGRIEESEILLDSVLEIVEKFKESEQRINSLILKAKIISKKDAYEGFKILKDIFNFTGREHHHANIFYELWVLTKDKNYQEKALEIYEKLYQKGKKHFYKNRIKTLNDDSEKTPKNGIFKGESLKPPKAMLLSQGLGLCTKNLKNKK